MTDYPDPLDQSRELKQISGEYEFEFIHLIKPYANDQHIEVHPNDDMDDGFFRVRPEELLSVLFGGGEVGAELVIYLAILTNSRESFTTVTELRKNIISHF